MYLKQFLNKCVYTNMYSWWHSSFLLIWNYISRRQLRTKSNVARHFHIWPKLGSFAQRVFISNLFPNPHQPQKRINETVHTSSQNNIDAETLDIKGLWLTCKFWDICGWLHIDLHMSILMYVRPISWVRNSSDARGSKPDSHT